MWVIKVVKFLIVKTQVEANRKSSLYGIFMMKIHIADKKSIVETICFDGQQGNKQWGKRTMINDTIRSRKA